MQAVAWMGQAEAWEGVWQEGRGPWGLCAARPLEEQSSYGMRTSHWLKHRYVYGLIRIRNCVWCGQDED